MSRPQLLLALVAMTGACAPPASPAPRRSAIINGLPDPGHPEVGLLWVGQEPACTATLIGSRTVLTAAHCLTDDEEPPYQLAALVSLELAGEHHQASQLLIHPAYSGLTVESDLAVVRLAQPVAGITPALVASAAPSLNEPITLVGFGCTTLGWGSAQTGGSKRKGENQISDLSATELSYPIGSAVASLCEGDSGGPSFAIRQGSEVLVGVHSYDLGDFSFDQRVDACYGWLDQQAAGDLRKPAPGLDGGTPPAEAGGDQLAGVAEVGQLSDGRPERPEDPPAPAGGCWYAPAAPAGGASLLLWLGLLVARRCRPARLRLRARGPS